MNKTHDIFQEIRERQIVGMMLHQQMADYYDFLDLHGFKRLHEVQFYLEAGSMRKTSRFYINNMGEIITEGHPGNPGAIPANWKGRSRSDVNRSSRPEYVKAAIEKWVTWERETKAAYEVAYKQLCDMGEVAAAQYVGELVKDVSCELKKAQRLHLKLEGMGYDMSAIFLMQDEMHEKYKCLTKEIGARYE